MILQLLIVTVAGWLHRHQQHVITYLKEENRVLKSKLPGGRIRLTEDVSEVLIWYALGVYESQSNPQRDCVTP